MGHRPRAKAACHGPAGDRFSCRQGPQSAGPRHAACGGPVYTQGHRGRMGRHPCLHAAASPPMSQWGGFGGREQSYGRRCAALVLVSQPPPRPPGPRGGGGWPRGHPRIVACPFRRRPRPARVPSPPLRRLRPRCHAASARPAPRPLPRSAAPPWLARSAVGRASPPAPASPPAELRLGARGPARPRARPARSAAPRAASKGPARRGFVAVCQLNLSYLHRAGNPLFYRVFR